MRKALWLFSVSRTMIFTFLRPEPNSLTLSTLTKVLVQQPSSLFWRPMQMRWLRSS